jgi:hypothetical protein
MVDLLDIRLVHSSTRQFCPYNNQIRCFGYKWRRYGAFGCHEITCCCEERGSTDPTSIWRFVQTSSALLWRRGGGEIWIIAGECFLRVYSTIKGPVSLLYEWVKTVSRVLIRCFLCQRKQFVLYLAKTTTVYGIQYMGEHMNKFGTWRCIICF